MNENLKRVLLAIVPLAIVGLIFYFVISSSKKMQQKNEMEKTEKVQTQNQVSGSTNVLNTGSKNNDAQQVAPVEVKSKVEVEKSMESINSTMNSLEKDDF